MATGKVQRCAFTLAAYEYSILDKARKAHANADALSRLPLPDTASSTPESGENVFVMQVLESTPVDAGKIKAESRRNPVRARVCKIVPDVDLRPYYNRRNELRLHDGCLLWGNRVLVPPTPRRQVI